MNPLGQLHPIIGRATKAADRIHPGACGIHHHPGIDLEGAAGKIVTQFHAKTRAATLCLIRDREGWLDLAQGGCGGSVDHSRTISLGSLQRLEGQAGVIGNVLAVDRCTLKTLLEQARNTRHGFVPVPDLVPIVLRHLRHLLERPEARSQLHQTGTGATMDRKCQTRMQSQMGRDFGQAFPLAICLQNEIDLSLLQIAQTPMDQFGRTA